MITDLIPQRDPILMIDDAQKDGEHAVKTHLKITPDNWFFSDGMLLEAGLVEHMAQSAAAMVGLQGDGDPKEGYIGDIKDFTVYQMPKEGEIIETTISIITQLDNITLIDAVSQIDNQMIAKARIKVFIAE